MFYFALPFTQPWRKTSRVLFFAHAMNPMKFIACVKEGANAGY
jgi:hypothetical protein